MDVIEPITVTPDALRNGIRHLGIAGKVVCVHASLRSFGKVTGGAPSVVQAFLDAGCTLLVPTFSYAFAVAPTTALKVARNGTDYAYYEGLRVQNEMIFTTSAKEIDKDMGAIPATVLHHPTCVRGDHPLNSLSAVGPRAAELVAGQKPLDVYAPLRALAAAGGFVLLMGVAHDKMTLLHHAEQVAGRVPFRRWANDPHGQPQMVEAGSCSDGFGQLATFVQPWQRTVMVGNSRWQLFPAKQTLGAAAAAIRENPYVTQCGRTGCVRCHDALLGGPLLDTLA